MGGGRIRQKRHLRFWLLSLPCTVIDHCAGLSNLASFNFRMNLDRWWRVQKREGRKPIAIIG